MDVKNNERKRNRIELLDGLRGIAVVLMCLHHFFYDLTEFAGAPESLFTNPVFDILHYVFASVFVVLCGVSSNFSRSNIKRGLKTAVAAGIITAVTVIIKMPILFGILHMLAFCMLFYGLTEKLWQKLPPFVMPVFCVAMTAVSVVLIKNISTDSHYLWMFGFKYKGFESYDYFPLLPWMFVFLFGTWTGTYIKNNRFPGWFYKAKMPFFSSVGRHALIIYMAHQPVLYVLTMLICLFVK